MKTLSTLVFCWISLAVFIPVGNAQYLEGKSNGFFYGAICPAFMDHFGTELLKDSLERAGLNKDASGPLSLVASAGVKFLFSGKDFNRGISSIGDRTPSEFISSELNKVDPNLSELQIGLRQLDELHTRLLEANGKSRLKK